MVGGNGEKVESKPVSVGGEAESEKCFQEKCKCMSCLAWIVVRGREQWL